MYVKTTARELRPGDEYRLARTNHNDTAALHKVVQVVRRGPRVYVQHLYRYADEGRRGETVHRWSYDNPTGVCLDCRRHVIIERREVVG